MTSVNALGYIGVGASDLDAWQNYATDVLGLECARDGDALSLRMDEAPWRIRVEDSDADDISFAGFEVDSKTHLTALGERLEGLGFEITQADPDACSARGVNAMLRSEDPNGIAVELYCGRAGSSAFTSPLGFNFVTGEQGLGHIVLMVDDVDACRRFYMEGLGFLLSDTITMGEPPRSLDLTFLHCNPRHHTLALAPVPGLPKMLNHVMLQVDDLDSVGTTLDTIVERELPLSTGLGKHTNDHMVSFYAKTPSGFDVEFGFGARTVDDATWTVDHYDSGSYWGHRPVA